MAKKKMIFANNPLLAGPALEDRDRSGIPYREIPIASIDRDPNQPRVNFDEERLAELAQSIKTYGVISPLLVKPSKTPGKYSLIAGERRLRASQNAGLTSVPVLIDQNADATGERTLAMQLVENLQRSDLTPLERAHAIGALKESFNLSVREVADKLGVSKSMVQRSLDILNLPDDLLNALREGAAESKVLLLSNIEDEEIRASYLKDLDVLTRSQIKKNLDRADTDDSTEGEPLPLSAEDQRLVDEMRRGLGLKVKMSRSRKNAEAGKIVVEFYSDQDLQEVFRKLVAE